MTPKILSEPQIPATIQPGMRLSIIEHSPLPMAMTQGGDHRVGQVNAAFCRLLNQGRETFVGNPFCSILQAQGARKEVFDRVYRTGLAESYTEEQLLSRSTVFWTFTLWPVMVDEQVGGVMCQLALVPAQLGRTLAMNEALVLGSVHQHELTEASENLNAQLREEIAGRIKVQRALAEKARLLDLSNDAIVVLDSGHHIQYWNRGAEKLYGWSSAEAVGQVSPELLRTRFQKPEEEITAELHRTGHWTGELTHVTRSGKWITVMARKVLDRDAQGTVVAILESMTDVTEQTKAVEDLREARTRLADRAGQLEELVAERTAELSATNQQLEAFANSVAHDLRAPLRAMQGFSSLVMDDTGTALSGTSRDLIQRIDQSAQFMDAMLSDLLAFSRISQQQLELKTVKLESVIGSVVARLQSEIQAIEACVECSGPWPEVRAHPGTLIQVLYNLASNALKFIRPGVPPLIRLRAEEGAGIVRVWVEDNGVGIEPDYLEQIFRLFVRLDRGKYPGTGAGLALVRKGVERMGGRVGVQSTPGQGSQFWIELDKAASGAIEPG